MKQSLFLRNKYVVILSVFVLVLSMSMLGCSGSNGSTGATGAAGANAPVTTGTVGGTVDSAAGTGLSGIQVSAYLSTSTTGGVKSQVNAYQSYQRAKNHAATANPVAITTTGSNGAYSLTVPAGTYDIDFVDPTGTYTIAAMDNYVVGAGSAYTINAGMGATSATNTGPVTGEAAASYPSVTVSPDYGAAIIGSGYTAEVGYGNPVSLTAQATSPVSGATLTPTWAFSFSANYGSATSSGSAPVPTNTTSGLTATVTTPTIAQAFGGVTGVKSNGVTYTSTTANSYPFNSGTYVPPPPMSTSGATNGLMFTITGTAGILPTTNDTRGGVSSKIYVTDQFGGKSPTVSVTTYAAAIQTGVTDVALGLPVYINSGHTGAANWTITAPSGSAVKTVTNATASQPVQYASFVPDVVGKYVVTDTASSALASPGNQITIYAGTWEGAITGGGETTQTVYAAGAPGSPAGYTQVTVGGSVVSNLGTAATGMWFTTGNPFFWGSGATPTASATYTNWPTVNPKSICMACHLTSGGFTITGFGGQTVNAPDYFTPWAYTVHATFFMRNINGVSDTSQISSCVVCHTLGYDAATLATGSPNNFGFSYYAALSGWTPPAMNTTSALSNWKAMNTNSAYSNLVQLAGIQCENCHGPQAPDSGSAHMSGIVGNTSTGVAPFTRVSYESEVCATCHGGGTSHNKYSEWALSGNPGTPGDTITILATPQTPAFQYAIVAGGAGAGHVGSSHSGTSIYCSKCHAAQGFTAYTKQLAQYNPQVPLSLGTGSTSVQGSVAGNLSPKWVPSIFTSSGTTVWSTVNHNATCEACHDPHSDRNPNQLRVYDSVPTSMAGMGASGLGKGAVCVLCHNSGQGVYCDSANPPLPNGACTGASGPQTTATPSSTYTKTGPTFLHEDTDTLAPNLLDTPEMVTQFEVLEGRDAFFMGNTLPMTSPHAAIQDSCVGCHMTLNPQTHGTTPAVSDHVWYITDAERPTLCANCHGGSSDAVSGLGIVSSTLNSMAQLNASMGPALLAQLPANSTIYVGGALNAVTGARTTTGTALNTSQITAVAFNNIINNPTSVIGSGSSFYFYTGGANYAVSGGLSTMFTNATGNTLVFGPNSKFKKAVWNIQLIAKDYSNGIHNPAFVAAVLANTLSAIQNPTVH